MCNILDKKNNGMANFFEHNTMPKREKYKWDTISQMGVYCLISKFDLNIDGRYQRKTVSQKKVLDIARTLDWKKFGVLSVVIRKDMTYWIYDGGHRARASFLRDDVDRLPCMVFESDGLVEEADIFIKTNTMKSVVTQYQKYCAGITAEGEIYLKIKKILARHGYCAAEPTGRKKHSFQALGIIHKLVVENEELAEKAFGLCAELAVDGEVFSGAILNGIYVCAKKLPKSVDMFSGEIKNKLKRSRIENIEMEINRKKHLLGRGGELVAALAVLDIINYKCRNKIHFVSGEKNEQ